MRYVELLEGDLLGLYRDWVPELDLLGFPHPIGEIRVGPLPEEAGSGFRTKWATKLIQRLCKQFAGEFQLIIRCQDKVLRKHLILGAWKVGIVPVEIIARSRFTPEGSKVICSGLRTVRGKESVREALQRRKKKS